MSWNTVVPRGQHVCSVPGFTELGANGARKAGSVCTDQWLKAPRTLLRKVQPTRPGSLSRRATQGQALQKLGRAAGDAPEGVKPRVFLPRMERGVRTRSWAAVSP